MRCVWLVLGILEVETKLRDFYLFFNDVPETNLESTTVLNLVAKSAFTFATYLILRREKLYSCCQWRDRDQSEPETNTENGMMLSIHLDDV